MKKGFCLFVFVLFTGTCFAQITGICDGPANNYIDPIDSTNFSGVSTPRFHLEIDTSLVGNLWQIGGVTKPGFPSSTYGGQAIQTDTINSYDTNNTSAFMVWTDSIYNQGGWGTVDSIHSLTFWHYYDVDSTGDSCLVQMTLDSGRTWINFSEYAHLAMQLLYDYSIPSVFSPLNTGKFLWSGRSQGWQKVKICFHYPRPFKPARGIGQVFGFRFLFKSDSIQTNKPGWIIDKINFFSPISPLGVNDFEKSSLRIYPNPSLDGKFIIDFPVNHVTGKFYVYDLLGRNVKTVPLTEHVDLSDLQSGLYSYKALFEKTNQWYSGKVEIK